MPLTTSSVRGRGSWLGASLAAAWPAATALLLLGYAALPGRFPDAMPAWLLGIALAEILGLGITGSTSKPARRRGTLPAAWRQVAAWSLLAGVALVLAWRLPSALAPLLLWLGAAMLAARLLRPRDPALATARAQAVTRDRLSLMVALLLLTTGVAAAVGGAMLLGLAEPSTSRASLLAWPMAGYFAGLALLQAHAQGRGFARHRRRLLDLAWIRRIEDLVFDR